MPRLPDTRYSLLARLAEPADAAAWGELVEIYEDAVFRYCRSHGLQDADAHDVVQQVLVTVHHKIGDWKPSGQPGAFRSWLLQTAHWICLRAFRDAGKRDRALGGSSVDHRLREVVALENDDEQVRDWQRWAFCWAAGMVEHEVAPATWRAFLLTAVENVSAPEAARELGVRVGAIYTAKCRVLARIRELVSELSRSER